MTCEETKELMAAYWAESLDDAGERALEAHLAGCEACRTEIERLGALWQDLAQLPAVEPGEAVRLRFYESLDAYRQGLESAPQDSWTARVAALWPRRPLAQMAIAASLLVAGVLGGYALRPSQPVQEITALKEEVAHMRQMVALSLLQQQSASERLRGVSWAYRSEPSDTEVLRALISTIEHDENVNVRLAAVDALRAFGQTPLARQAAVDALPRQNAPLVQVALIDLLVDMRDRDAVGDLNRLASTGEVNESVKERARWAMGELQ